MRIFKKSQIQDTSKVYDVVQKLPVWCLAEYIHSWKKEDCTYEEIMERLEMPVSEIVCNEDSCAECGFYYPDGCVRELERRARECR